MVRGRWSMSYFYTEEDTLKFKLELSIFWWARVLSVAIFISNSPIRSMDYHFRMLIYGNLPCLRNSFCLCTMSRGHFFIASSSHSPPKSRLGLLSSSALFCAFVLGTNSLFIFRIFTHIYINEFVS